MGLYVCVLGTEQLLDACYCKALGLVNNLATSVVTLTGITLGVLVGKTLSHGLHNLVTYKVLGGNKLDAFCLALVFALNDVKNFLVSFHCLLYWFKSFKTLLRMRMPPC